MNRIINKKERLIEAATDLIYEKGFANTSLADIANKAEVPLGNVYYYFKSKESLAKAVIETRQSFYREQLEALDKLESPELKLSTYLGFVEEFVDDLVKHGCPVGSLCQELDKSGEPVADDINALVKTKLEWITEQFIAMGESTDEAKSQAIEFLSSLQGAIMLANSLNEKSILLDRLAGMRRQLDELSARE